MPHSSLRFIFAIALSFFFAHAASAQVQFFPPQGPCNADKPILAWDGNGSTYCTSFPTATLPDCGDEEYLTKKNGNLVCAKLKTGAVSSSTPAAPAAPTSTTQTAPTPTAPTPTPAYNSNGTPTGAAPSVAATNGATYPNPVQRSGNNACPDITIPTCASDSVLVNYGLDFNGCQTSPQCKYMGSTEAATAAKASYANGGLSNNGVASTNGTGTPSVANGGVSNYGTASTNGSGTRSYANGGISNNSVASSNGYGYYNPYASGNNYNSYYSSGYYQDSYYYNDPYYYSSSYDTYVAPNDYVESGYSYND